MMNITGGKMLYHLDRVFGDQRPITADIFLNNYCNNSCPYCVYKRWELDSGAYSMPFDDFVLYAKRLIEFGVQGIILTGGGEPTIAKDFDKICKWLEENKIHYGINTNFNVLKKIKPDYLKVSLDGWDEDSYERFRGVRKYGTVRENILKYHEWREKENCKTTLGIQKLITEPEEVFEFYEGNKDLPVDYMSLRPMESTGGSYYTSTEAKEKAKKIIANIESISDDRVVLNFKWGLIDKKPENGCAAHWAQMAINEKGQLIYCCHKPYEIVCDLLDADAVQKYREAKTDISKCDVPCRLTAPNICLQNIESVKDPMFI